MQQTEIITDETMRELCKHGTPVFPFAYYDENLRQFQRGCIDWHWHREIGVGPLWTAALLFARRKGAQGMPACQ